jgi:hypothetical protein
MSDKPTCRYDIDKREALITFPNGKTLTLGNVSAEQAASFLERHAPEFQKRDCCLQTVDGSFTRDGHE